MSEAPEKKVLRELLGKLKVKTISSETQFQKSRVDLYNKITNFWKTLTEMVEKKQIDMETASFLGFVFSGLDGLIDMALTHSITTLEDFKIYMDALERYSSELDKTLTGIFEQARKMAEEQRKKQEELTKRKPPKSYRM